MDAVLAFSEDVPARQNRQVNPNPVNRVWFDDIVVATEYIGPVTS
jgi:hypothetical protein